MPPWGTTRFSWTFMPPSAHPSRLPTYRAGNSQKTRGNLQRSPAPASGLAAFLSGSLSTAILLLLVNLFLHTPEETSPRSPNPGIV